MHTEHEFWGSRAVQGVVISFALVPSLHEKTHPLIICHNAAHNHKAWIKSRNLVSIYIPSCRAQRCKNYKLKGKRKTMLDEVDSRSYCSCIGGDSSNDEHQNEGDDDLQQKRLHVTPSRECRPFRGRWVQNPPQCERRRYWSPTLCCNVQWNLQLHSKKIIINHVHWD